MTQTPNLMIGTPAYNGMVHTDYLHAVLSFHRVGIRFSVATIGNESLITRARNSLLAKFHEIKAFTHLLFLDGDVFLDGNDLQRLLDHDRDVIGAPVALKYRDAAGKSIHNVGRVLEREGELARVERVGTAVLLLSRRAVDALVADAAAAGLSYRPNPLTQRVPDSPIQYDVFRVGVIDGEYLSEDFWACRRLRELGFEVYVDLAVRTRHSGVAPF